MKKLSISAFAILALVFAVTSAFTNASKSNDGGVLTYKWYHNLQPGSQPSPTAQQIVDQQSDFVPATEEGIPTQSFVENEQTITPEDFDQYKSDVCQSPTTPVCLLLIRFSDGANPAIVATVFGTYTPL